MKCLCWLQPCIIVIFAAYATFVLWVIRVNVMAWGCIVSCFVSWKVLFKKPLKPVLVAEGELLYLFISVRALTFFFVLLSSCPLAQACWNPDTGYTSPCRRIPTPDEVEEPVAVGSVGFTQYASENIFITPTRSTPLPALWWDIYGLSNF